MYALFYVGNKSDKDKFKEIKDMGYCGIVAVMSENVKKQAELAEKEGLEFWLSLAMSSVYKYEYVKSNGIGVGFGTANLGYTSEEDVKRALDKLGEKIGTCRGVILAYPYFKEVIWTKEFEKDYRNDFGGAPENGVSEMFDDTEVSALRMWYYEKASKYVFSKFIKPAAEYIKSIGKTAVCNIGHIRFVYEFARKGMNLANFYNSGISLAAGAANMDLPQIIGMMSTVSAMGHNYIITSEPFDAHESDIGRISSGDYIEEYTSKRGGENILAVVPMRSGIEHDCRNFKGETIIENPVLEISEEAKFFCDMLYRKGYVYSAAGEKQIEKFAEVKDGKIELFGKKYDSLIICPSCKFTAEGEELIRKAREEEISVNSEELLNKLKNEDDIQFI